MQVETVQAESQPMLCLTRSTQLDPAAVSKVIEEAIQTLAAFIQQNHILVAGSPLAIYRDFKDGNVTLDIGFPIPTPEITASGELKVGETPSGRVLKVVHRGPYERLRETYLALEDRMKESGLPRPAMFWEVYLSDPDTTPPAELLTEIYMPVP